jgi:hypothetical protein
MIPFGMEMFDIFAQGSPQGALAKEDHLGQALLFHRPDPALRIGIQKLWGRRRGRGILIAVEADGDAP